MLLHFTQTVLFDLLSTNGRWILSLKLCNSFPLLENLFELLLAIFNQNLPSFLESLVRKLLKRNSRGMT